MFSYSLTSLPPFFSLTLVSYHIFYISSQFFFLFSRVFRYFHLLFSFDLALLHFVVLFCYLFRPRLLLIFHFLPFLLPRFLHPFRPIFLSFPIIALIIVISRYPLHSRKFPLTFLFSSPTVFPFALCKFFFLPFSSLGLRSTFFLPICDATKTNGTRFKEVNRISLNLEGSYGASERHDL